MNKQITRNDLEWSDREQLEWLVYACLTDENPCISIGRGKELLGFTDMQQMRDWMNEHRKRED